MGEIKFDFQTAINQEKRLAEIAARMGETADGSYADVLQELRQGWQDEGGRKFVDKGLILQEKMHHTGTLIRQAEEALHRASAKAKRIEEKAREIARNRTVDQ